METTKRERRKITIKALPGPSPPAVNPPNLIPPQGPDVELAQDFYNAVMFSMQDNCNCISSRILREKIAPKMFRDMRTKYGY